MLKIGSHVSMSGPEGLVTSVKEAVSYGANTFMFYTGAPQNTFRKPISELNIEEAKKMMLDNNIDINDIVVHAPYIINLANTIKEDTFELAVEFLRKEIDRVEAIGAKILVLHPGSHVNAGEDTGIKSIIKGLNMVLREDDDIVIALETMAGKGSEVGYNIEQIASIIDGVYLNSKLGICLDTCHLHDSGFDIINNFEDILSKIDELMGLDKIKAIHINDSKNICGARKDRHENLGYGHIGFESLCKIVFNEKLKDVPKILETPYIKDIAPYKYEIEMLRNRKFNDFIKELP